MSATMGGLIKDYRMQKNLSQMEVSFALGWKEPSQLSRIEQGRVSKPNVRVINKLSDAMNLDAVEKNTLLLAGGYLPDEKDIELARSTVKLTLENWKYPAYLIDFSWRLIDINKPGQAVYQIDNDTKNNFYRTLPRITTLVFSKDFFQNQIQAKKLKDEWNTFLKFKLNLFKHSQRGRTKDTWYNNHIKEMIGSNKLFRDIWLKSKTTDPNTILNNYEYKSLLNIAEDNKVFKFHLFKSEVVQDPRFEINFHIPADYYTFKYFDKK